MRAGFLKGEPARQDLWHFDAGEEMLGVRLCGICRGLPQEDADLVRSRMASVAVSGGATRVGPLITII